MKKHRPLIIGCGKQGIGEGQGKTSHKIINFAHALTENPRFDEIVFYDKNYSKANKAALDWNCYWTKGIEQPIDNPNEYDVVIITTPDNTHFQILKALTLVSWKPKLVICEKPICEDLQQAREIVELYKAKGIPLCVNYTRQFLPYYEDLKRRYESGEFGRIVSANVVFNRGWLHSATHAISFLEWFFDGQYNGKIMECETDYRIWQMDLYFEKYHWREERIGEQPVWPYYDKSHWYVIDNAFQFLEGKEVLKCTGEDALKALEICYKLMEVVK